MSEERKRKKMNNNEANYDRQKKIIYGKMSVMKYEFAVCDIYMCRLFIFLLLSFDMQICDTFTQMIGKMGIER